LIWVLGHVSLGGMTVNDKAGQKLPVNLQELITVLSTVAGCRRRRDRKDKRENKGIETKEK